MNIKQLVNCNLYANGGSFLGAVLSITLPEIKSKTVEHKAGDAIGTAKLPGAFEPMTCTIKMNGMYEDFHAITADPNSMVNLMVRGNQKVRNGIGNIADEPVMILLRGWFSSRKVGELKSSESAQPEYVMEVFYYQLVVANLPIEEVDIENSVHRVEGVDLLSDFRSNLGL